MINHIFMKQRIALAGGVIASIVTGMMGIALYSSANPGAFGWVSAIGIFLAIEIISVLAAITIFSSSSSDRNELIVYFSVAMLIACISTEVFVTASKMQAGVLKKVESAKYTESSSDTVKQLQNQLGNCPKNHYTNCKKPLLEAIKTAQTTGGAFNADSAAEKSKWISLADWYNSGKLSEDHIKPEQAAFWVWLVLGVVIAIGKVFLYAIWGSLNRQQSNDSNYQKYESDHNYSYSHHIGRDSYNRTPAINPTDIAGKRWGGRVSVLHGSTAPVVEAVPVQSTESQDEKERSRLETIYAIYRKAVANNQVRPTVRPTVDFLIKHQVVLTNEQMREIASHFITRLIAEEAVYKVDGRTTTHPKGQYEPTGKFK